MGTRGFTLVEMLVALALFAGVAAIGVGLLRGSVTSQTVMQDRLGAMGSVVRLRAIMAQDVGQAVARPTRSRSGAAVPAFSGDGAGFTLVTAAADRDGTGPGLHRVHYALAGGEWRRAVDPVLDGADAPAAGAGDRLADAAASAALRYRSNDGNWHSGWPLPGPAAAAEPLPRAVELVLVRDGRPALTMQMVAGPAPAPVIDGPRS